MSDVRLAVSQLKVGACVFEDVCVVPVIVISVQLDDVAGGVRWLSSVEHV